jgi:hypothetical protein
MSDLGFEIKFNKNTHKTNDFFTKFFQYSHFLFRNKNY